MSSIVDIYLNANKFIKYDINGIKKSKSRFRNFTFNYLPVIFSVIIVFIFKANFDFDTKTIGALLSLFTGLLFGQLLKISDKVRQVSPKENADSENKKNKRIQELNYLKIFFYFLSYSILIAIGIITLLIIQSFIPQLREVDLSNFILSDDINIDSILVFIKILFIYLFRFIIVLLIIRFIQYIIWSIIYIYDYIKFDFSRAEY